MRRHALSLARLVWIPLAVCTSLALAASGPEPVAPNALHKLDATMRLELHGAPITPARLISVFAWTADIEATKRAVAGLGGKIGTVSGDIVTIRLPVGAVAALAAEPSVLAIEGARPVHRRIDRARQLTGVDDVHNGTAPLPVALQGQGVIMGVVDIDFDLTHESFLDEQGASRVLALWDQQHEGSPPEGYSYGHLCDTYDIASGACEQVAPNDLHGTHVTGIAAGSAVAGSPYKGVAPLADIIFVNLGGAPGRDRLEALTTAVCDAAAFIFGLADEANQPAVINMSLGEHSGPHDGTSLADRCLDNLTGPGRIIVAAAGNEGNGALHNGDAEPVLLHAAGIATEEPVFIYFRASVAAEPEYIYIWTDGDVTLSVSIGLIDEHDNPMLSDPITLGESFGGDYFEIEGVTLGPVMAASGSAAAGRRSYTFEIHDENEDELESQPVWLLAVSGDGRFDAWIDTTTFGGFRASDQAPTIEVDNAMGVGFPGIASQVIAVASYVSRNAWVNSAGEEVLREQLEPGSLSVFSSYGPARSTEVVGIKPDVAAPGEMVVAASRSGVEVPPDEIDNIVVESPNGYHASEGTSMASPHVAGVIALMLEAQPQLTVGEIRTIFESATSLPDYVDGPNYAWGLGAINALAAVLAVTGEAPDEDPVEPSPEPQPDVGPEPSPEPQPEAAAEPGTVAEPAPPTDKDKGGCAGGAPLPGLALGLALIALMLRGRSLRRRGTR